MTNLTITVDEDVLKKARLRALQQGVSVNALLSGYLASYAGADSTREQAVADLLRISAKTKSARGNRKWNRDALHER